MLGSRSGIGSVFGYLGNAVSLRNGALLKQLPMGLPIPLKSECVEPVGSNQRLTPRQIKRPR